MSYFLYLNGLLTELSDSKPLAQTKQVNDIAKLDNRQTNYSNKIILPLTANNIRVMDKVYLAGNQSDIPYTKVVVDLYDIDSGECLIYKGWGNLSGTKDAGYELHIYDGIIDFYRAIENKTLTDIDLTPLNHLKNLQSVIDSFTMALPYRYLVGDYNGKNTELLGNQFLDLNIDYQVPSARNSWLWNRVFDFIGWTFSGNVFETEAFKNFYMTFPKPVPQSVPVTTLLTSQDSNIRINTVQEPGPTPGSLEYVSFYYAILLPNAFSTPFGNHNANDGFITITTTGSYVIRASGAFTDTVTTSSVLVWNVRSTSNVVITSGEFDCSIDPYIIIPVTAGNRVFISTPITGFTSSYANRPMSGNINISFEHVDGFNASFSEVLVDFKITDYVNEITQRFGLTAFKDKYENHVEFLTLEEIINNDVEDWSKVFSKKKAEVYVYGNYAKKNRFKYRYNDENDKHHDGFIEVINENLKDEITVIPSKIYAPDKGLNYLGNFYGVFRMWNKEIKDDGTVNYKDLTGRYYFLKEELINNQITIGSKALNIFQQVSKYTAVSYNRMTFVNVIEDNYSYMQTLLNKAKTLDVDFYLSPKKVANFDFKRLIYSEQLGSYYLVNKIKGFLKNKVVTCELIEVDIDQKSIIGNPVDVFLTLLSQTIVNCEMLISVYTNILQPVNVSVSFDFPVLVPGSSGTQTYSIDGVLENDIITIPIRSVLASPFYAYTIRAFYISPLFVTTQSNFINAVVPDGCYISSGQIIVTSYTRNPNENMKVTITTDIPFPFNVAISGSTFFPAFNFFPQIQSVATSNVIEFADVPAGLWSYRLQAGIITSNDF
jgi:hypothetical protein